jgi:hypothetical protein
MLVGDILNNEQFSRAPAKERIKKKNGARKFEEVLVQSIAFVSLGTAMGG